MRPNGIDRGLFERPVGSGIWHIRYYRDGREHREVIGRKSDAQAAYLARKAGLPFISRGVAEAALARRHDTGHRGATAELAVCLDLLRRGFEAYRNVAPTGGDLIARCGPVCCAIEVKHGDSKARATQEFHVIARVYGETVSYEPDIEAWFRAHTGQGRKTSGTSTGTDRVGGSKK